MPVLLAAGFEEQSLDVDHIILKRSDPVILYMFVDILNEAIEVSKSALLDFVAAIGQTL